MANWEAEGNQNWDNEGNQNWGNETEVWKNPIDTTDAVAQAEEGVVAAAATTTTTTGEETGPKVDSVEDARTKLVEKRTAKALLSGILNLADTVRDTRATFMFSVIPHSVYSAFRVAPDKLRQLWLTNNKLAILTGEIKMFTNLRILGLGGNELGELPVEIGQLPKLEQLFLEKNVLKSLPNELGDCVKLATLLLDHNTFQAFPMPVTKCRNLVRLGLSHNKIKALPFEVSNPPSLNNAPAFLRLCMVVIGC
jgi:Leucine-rich repeat (LRR) protein